METTPRITSIYEQEREEKRRKRLRKQAQEQAAKARQKAVTAFTLIRMMFQLGIAPNRATQGQVLKNNLNIAKEARSVARGRRGRIFALGRNVLAAR